METFIRGLKPALCVFDPVQGFIPPELNMGSRNAMRDCLAPLVSPGEATGTTSLIIAHTNKRKAASGRDRIADSADLWDISRSVIMMGYTEEEGVRYLSHEKSNYGMLQDTMLFSIDRAGMVHKTGTTRKRDRDFQADAQLAAGKPKREDCKSAMVEALAESSGSMPSAELADRLKRAGYATATVRRAREELKQEGRIALRSTGSRSNKVWHTALTSQPPKMEELPEDPPVPFEGGEMSLS